MKRGFATFAAACLLASLATASGNAQEIEWKFSLWGNPRVSSVALDELERKVSEATDGKFRIKMYYGSALSKPAENLDGLKLGAFEMALVCAAYHPDKTPTLKVADLPLLPIPNLDVQQAVHEAVYAHPAVKADFARWNAGLYMTNLVPLYEFMGRGEPPMQVADWKGKKVRAPGGMGKAMASLGAIPTSAPAPEVYGMMERGAIDAVGLGLTYGFVNYGIYEIGNWYTTNMSLGAPTCPILYNLDAYAKLPDSYKTILEELKPHLYAMQKRAYVEADKTNYQSFEKRALTTITYSEEQLREIRAIGARPEWDAIAKEIAAQGVPAQELLELILATAKQATSTQ